MQIEWTEQYIESLPREDNRVEKKSSGTDDWTDDKFRAELAKQLSAFANTGGGSLIFGANDEGMIDGGLRLVRRGRQSTKEWLEDIIPHSTEPEIIGFRVIELQPSSGSTHIEAGKAVFVIEIPDSDRAPHQSVSDLLYYVRIGSKSRPAPHRIIEDIRNRAVYPLIRIWDLKVVEVFYSPKHHTWQEGEIILGLHVAIENAGKVMSPNTCIQLSGSQKLSLRAPMSAGLRYRGENSLFTLIDFDNILYPEMKMAHRINVGFDAVLMLSESANSSTRSLMLGHDVWQKLSLTAKVYAGNASPHAAEFKLRDIDREQRIDGFIDEYKMRLKRENRLP